MDEVEKAHSDVFNILLQVLDDGRLTDGQGRTVDFRNTVIIMTSNLGSDAIQNAYSNGDQPTYESMKVTVMDVVSHHFRPEFINRIDDTVVFHPLTHAEIKEIAGIQLISLRKRLAEQEVELELTETALERIADAGFDPVFGARPLKRAIQMNIENTLAQALLSGQIKPKDQLKMDVVNDKFVLV